MASLGATSAGTPPPIEPHGTYRRSRSKYLPHVGKKQVAKAARKRHEIPKLRVLIVE